MAKQLPFTAEDILTVVGKRKGRITEQRKIIAAIITYLPVYGVLIGILRPHRLCDWLAQIAHESAQFAYTSEIGGHRARYAPWFGRGLIQLTWLANYQAFVRWLWAVVDKATSKKSPDYSTAKYRDMVAEMPVAFLTAIFYWQWRKLNKYADTNNFRRQTKVINGGYNGWNDRVKKRGRFGLILLGYKIQRGAYRKFQKDHGLPQTDKYDDATQQKMFEVLLAADPITFDKPEVTKPGTFQPKLQEILMGIGTLITAGLKIFGGPKSAGILGGLLTALGLGSAGIVDTSQAPVGLDLLKGDWGALIGSGAAGLIALAQNLGNIFKAKAAAMPLPPIASPLDAHVAEAQNLYDLDGDGVIDEKEISAAIKRAMSEKSMDDNAVAYGDVLPAIMSSERKSWHEGMVAGLDLGCLLRDRYHASKKLQAAK